MFFSTLPNSCVYLTFYTQHWVGRHKKFQDTVDENRDKEIFSTPFFSTAVLSPALVSALTVFAFNFSLRGLATMLAHQIPQILLEFWKHFRKFLHRHPSSISFKSSIFKYVYWFSSIPVLLILNF